MSNIFNQVENERLKDNVFNLSHSKKLSCKMGQLIPICTIDTVPGDKFNINGNAMVRFAPLIAPMMHSVNVYMHYFFVPNRIIWDGWEDFITGGEDGMDTTVHPYISMVSRDATLTESQISQGSLADYMDIPMFANEPENPKIITDINALPFAAYQKIYNDYYRDQNLEEYVTDNCEDGLSSPDLNQLRYRAWQHDYFTSALPWTQKGPEAMLPLSGSAPVRAVSWEDTGGFTQPVRYSVDPNGGEPVPGVANLQAQPNGNLGIPGSNVYLDLNDTNEAILSEATSSSIIDLRRAVKLQTWLEKNARGGSRYIESMLVHFGVQSSDKRLQRPEYLGGLSTPVKISEVLQTSNNDTQETPQGNMAGHGISVGGGKIDPYYCEEHGWIIGIMSIRPKTAYQDGIPKKFLRTDKFDYYWNEFAHIGEQPIQNKELFVSGGETDEETFGYVPRYAEYKFMNDSVNGDFRNTLDMWHLGRKFSALPALNADFIKLQPEDVERIFAVQDGTDNLWIQVINDIKARRKMPIFGTPKF